MYKLMHGDCREQLKNLSDDSIDAIVTDPPYGLSFMGKKWDYDVPGVDVWRECLRVLKPGGHILAFAGSRTYHRMAVNIEDAGFEIRDQLMWIYGSGFPKSLDISKAIDKTDAAEARRERRLKFTAWMRETGLTRSQIDQITGTNMGGHYLTQAQQPAVATREHFEKLRPYIPGDVPAWVEQMVDERTVESENFKRREVIGKRKGKDAVNADLYRPGDGIYTAIEFDETLPHTDAAKQWHGWGTALKPAHEPIVLARKPLIGTVADNMLKHGTGGLNIDGCRVDFASEDDLKSATFGTGSNIKSGRLVTGGDSKDGRTNIEADPAGRWPANVLHDGSDEVVGCFPGQNKPDGSAARFFYCAKASKADRDEGVHPAKNFHPTVKPTALMRYLCRLITPRGGDHIRPVRRVRQHRQSGFARRVRRSADRARGRLPADNNRPVRTC